MLNLVVNNVHDISKIVIVPTQPHHLRELGKNLRPEDEAEITAFLKPSVTLWRSYKRSLITKTALLDNKVVACWGVAGVFMGELGQPWLLTSPLVYEIPAKQFVKVYQSEVESMFKIFNKLSNYVAPEYKAAIKLLKMTGFTVDEPLPFHGVLMCKFHRSI